MVRLNLTSDNERNWEETTTFVKELEKKILSIIRKGNFSLAYKDGLLFEKVTELEKFNEMCKKKWFK